jgi:hypothetical protein
VTATSHSSSRRFIRNAIAAAVAIGLIGWFVADRYGYDGPTKKSMLPEARLVYPGATLTYVATLPERHGRGLDQDLSGGFRYRAVFHLDKPVPGDSVRAWYGSQLTAKGWSVCPHDVVPFWCNMNYAIGFRNE